MSKLVIGFFLTLALLSYGTHASSEGVEIEFDGLSPAAQLAIKNMSKERQEVKGRLEEPMGRLKSLKKTYKNSCGGGRPKDSGCQDQFNQIIDAHKSVMETVSGFLNKYNENLKVVVEEIEPQIEAIAYNNTPSDIVENLVGKYEEIEEEFVDPFAVAIQEAFGLGTGETEFEIASSSYIEYKNELKQYKRLGNMLQGKIYKAERQRDLGQILNPTTQEELKNITSWIYGRDIKKYPNTQHAKRTRILR